jgi:hypothetical protein
VSTATSSGPFAALAAQVRERREKGLREVAEMKGRAEKQRAPQGGNLGALQETFQRTAEKGGVR